MQKGMRKGLLVALGALTLTVFGSQVGAEDSLVDNVKKACEKELKSYCNNVTPGEGRIASCLYAYEDKLSTRCDYALYDAAAQLEHALTALTYVANECNADLKEYCSSVESGEGRLLKCLEKNESKVSGRCKQAFKDVGGKK
jgi:hypothetical protein